MAKESSVRVSSIRSSCMYEVADFFIIIGLYVFQIRIQFCNFFFFSFFCLIMLKSPKFFTNRLYRFYHCVYEKIFHFDSRIEKSEGKRSNIHANGIGIQKKKILLLYRTVCSVFLFFLFFSFPIFLTAITKDSKRLQGLLLCIKKNNRNSWRRNGAEQNSIFVLAMSHRGILSLSLQNIIRNIQRVWGSKFLQYIRFSVTVTVTACSKELKFEKRRVNEEAREK